MKALAIALAIMLSTLSLAWGESPKQVEVVNTPLEVDLMNQPDPQNVVIDEGQLPIDVNILGQSGPLEVEIVNQAQPVQFEYYSFERGSVGEFQVMLDEKAAEGYKLNFFTAYGIVDVGNVQRHYIGIMRKPVPAE